jgi:hypothetical protein
MSSSTIRQHYYRHPLYDKMVDEWDLFNTYVDFFVFAGSVGYATIDKTTAASYDEAEFAGEGETQQEMLWMHLSNKQTYRAVAASIAYQHTNRPRGTGRSEDPTGSSRSVCEGWRRTTGQRVR